MEQSFDFNLDTIIQFTQGDCGILAHELSLVFQTPIYGIIEYGAPRTQTERVRARAEPVHYVVQSPCNSNHFIDIRGIWTEEALLEEEKNYQVELSSRNQIYSYRLELIHEIENLEMCSDLEQLDEIVRHISEIVIC